MEGAGDLANGFISVGGASTPEIRYSMIGFAMGAMLAGIAGGLLVSIVGVNSGIGGPVSIKAFMMVMIGGAGVISGAIAGGFILGMLESVGLTVLAAYGDITYCWK